METATGELTPVTTGSCGIELTISKTGYTDEVHNYSLTIAPGTFASVTWADFPAIANLDTTTDALASPTSDPVADTYTISVTSGDCTWDNTARTISFTGTTKCVMSVLAEKTYYTDMPHRSFEVTPLKPIAVSDWGNYTNPASW